MKRSRLDVNICASWKKKHSLQKELTQEGDPAAGKGGIRRDLGGQEVDAG